MKRVVVTEPEAGILRVEVLEAGHRKGSYTRLEGNSFNLSTVLDFITGTAQQYPSAAQLELMRRVLRPDVETDAAVMA